MVDLLIKNGKIVTMDNERTIIDSGSIAIEEGKIIAVGKSDALTKEYKSEFTVDAKDKIVIPGLINTHTHLYQNLLKGMTDSLTLVDWISEVLYPLSHVANEDLQAGRYDIGYYGALMAFLEMLRSGTTCFVGMDGPNPFICKAAKEIGIRGIHSLVMVDIWIPEDVRLPVEKQVELSKEIITKWHGAENGRIKCMIGPSTPFCCTEEFLLECKRISDKHNLWLNIHMSETEYEVKLIKDNYGKRPAEFLNDIGFLSPKLLAVHCVHLDEKEIRILKSKDVKVSHNPESNMKLASGIAPIIKMLNSGITVGLATDGSASNDNLDMFEAMRTAAFLHKLSTGNPRVISAQKVLEMATIDAARAIGLSDEVGSIEVGKKADITIINAKKASLQPIHDVVQTLVYCASGADVATVIIDGKIIFDEGRIITLDEEKIIEKANEVALDTMRRAKEYLPKASWMK
ncbi:MAG: amidohydrolase [Candidatus Bathyarchaeia archaeon]